MIERIQIEVKTSKNVLIQFRFWNENALFYMRKKTPILQIQQSTIATEPLWPLGTKGPAR